MFGWLEIFSVYHRREAFAVHCERVARGNARAFGAFHYEAAHARELCLEDARGGRRLFAAERVAAYELAEHPRLVRGRHLVRAHLIEAHLHAAARELPRRLGAGEAAARDSYGLTCLRHRPPPPSRPRSARSLPCRASSTPRSRSPGSGCSRRRSAPPSCPSSPCGVSARLLRISGT